MENDDLSTQDTFCGVADSPQDIPSGPFEDPSFSFAIGTSTTPCSSSSKDSEYRLPSGDKVRDKSFVRKSSSKGKSLGNTHGSIKQNSMGNTPTGEGDGPVERNDGSNKIKPNYDLGVVRPGRDDGMEPHFSFDAGEPTTRDASFERPGVGGVDKPMVGFPFGQTNGSRSTNLRVESAISSITGAKLERLNPTGRSRGKDNFELRNCGNGVQGEYEKQNGDTSGGANLAIQPTDMLKRIPTGSLGTCSNHGEKRVDIQENLEGDGMEGIEQDGSPKPL